MNADDFFTPGSPSWWWAHMSPGELDDLRDRLVSAEPELAVVMLRGWKSKDTNSFFSELGAALQLPYYFDETWAGAGEMISDRGRWPKGNCLVMVNSAEQLLTESPLAELRAFVETLRAALGQGGLKAVLAYWAPDGGEGLARLRAAGGDPEPLPVLEGPRRG